MNTLQHAAPGLRLELRYLPHSPALTELLAGEVDLALGFSTIEDRRYPELEEISWFEDEYVVISNASRSALTLEDYLAARHLVVTPWNEKQGCWICSWNAWVIPDTLRSKPRLCSAPRLLLQKAIC